MNKNIPFGVIDWTIIPKEEHKGERETSFWQVMQLPGLRIRMVEYLPGYLADHWCRKGHIVHCIKGSFDSDLESGESFHLTEGMTYIVSDDMSSHKSFSKDGVKLLIIDGDFLRFHE